MDYRFNTDIIKSKEFDSNDSMVDWLNENSKEWKSALSKKSSLESLRKYFKISKDNAEKYNTALSNG